MWAIHWGNAGVGWAVLTSMVMLFSWLALFWASARFIRGAGARGESSSENPLDIATRRFAEGAIDDEEYERIVARLRR